VDPDALAACRYVIARVQSAAGTRWRQGARPRPLPCAADAAEARLVAERRLWRVPEAAARALTGWLDGARPAVRLTHAPSPRAVLALAARGRRPVSLLDGADGLAFALHDLCHLEKFAEPAHHQAQVGLFALLDGAVDGPAWAALESNLDDTWRAHRDHVLADMNGSAVYLFVVLRARLLEACVRARVPAEPRVRQFAAALGVAPDAAPAALAARFSSVGAAVLSRVSADGLCPAALPAGD
jgi:hypothetical protein